MTTKRATPSVSVVIPCFNAAAWLPETIGRVADSLASAQLNWAEIIVIDDGSTDDSAAVAAAIHGAYPVRVVRQPNRGKYFARKAGVERAEGEYILFLDTRVYVHQGAVSFVAEQLQEHPDRRIWNGHVEVAKRGNIIARFGDAITFIGWRRYFRHPRTTTYGLEDFDHYPKGTTMFFVPRAMFMGVLPEFERTTHDFVYSSDDTMLIRLLARDNRINISPGFSCTYHARTRLRQFSRHTYIRGKQFVDGFLRPETRFFWPLVGFLIVSAALLPAIIVRPQILSVLLEAAGAIWAIELVAAMLLGVPIADALSLFILSPLFTVFYGLGIWRAVIKRFGRI